VKVAVAGAGYVGLSNAVLLAKHHSVTIVEPNTDKVTKIKSKISPIVDQGISDMLARSDIDLSISSDADVVYRDSDCVFVAAPTNYSEADRAFDTKIVEGVVECVLKNNRHALIVIKSTVPIGFTKHLSEKMEYPDIFFSPEFLREGRAFYDCLHPSRILVGVTVKNDRMKKKAENIAKMLKQGAENDPTVMIMGTSEAEAVKLFSNTYLAMRIGFFNELDSYSEKNGLNSSEIIKGMSLDSRIGGYYNNPSFGYGGYCLPKDSKELLSEFSDVPQHLISAIVDSNETRKDYIVSRVVEKNPETVGIFRLVMKADSDNFREASIIDVMKKLHSQNINIVVYEPLIQSGSVDGFEVINDLDEFAGKCDLILANRLTEELTPYTQKVYTRDIFRKN